MCVIVPVDTYMYNVFFFITVKKLKQ